jgi:mannosyltransferase OCH1-like enzyme
MNYHLIKNRYDIIEYNYSDKFDIIIYYLNSNYCQINVRRIDSDNGWGLNLELKIYDINNENYDLIFFGNSNENNKTISFQTSIYLEYKNNDLLRIPKVIYPVNEKLLINEYKIYNYDNKFIDLHIVLYYLDNYKLKIIIRRLDNDSGWDNDIKLILFDKDFKNRKELITIGQSNLNYKYLFINTKIKLYGEDKNYYQEIPKIIFQTGFSNTFKNILHFNSIISFIELNPEYTYIYYNDTDSRKFLRDNCNDEINNAYDSLVPGAFKADLLRYCFLYHNGGCYFDCKQILKISIRRFLESNKTLVLCNDVIENALLNAVIFSVKKNPILEKTIKDCVYNILNKNGSNPLDVSGPIFFFKSIKKYINENNLILQNNRPTDNFNDFCNDYLNNNIKIIKDGRIILNRFYKGYYINYLETNHYGKLFNNDEVYYKNFQYLDTYKIGIYPNPFNDKFLFKIIGNKLFVKRVDSKDGWFFNLKVLIIYENYEEKIINIGISDTNIKEITIS